MNTRLEVALTRSLFAGSGACLTVCSATIGLMLAIRECIGETVSPQRRYALVPSFTFAATAQAAIWCGLTPLFCDVEPDTWLPCPHAEEELLEWHKGEVAVLVPYATFGNCLDLGPYDRLSRQHDVPVVVDAAASLGSIDTDGNGFGAGCRSSLVYSTHATKTFATAEAGMIYCAHPDRLSRLRRMDNFGFGQPRTATMPGLNFKLSDR